MQNSNFPSVLETSRNFLELWILPGNSLFQANFDIMGINSTVFLSLNMNLASKIEKVPHTLKLVKINRFQAVLDVWNPGYKKTARGTKKHGIFHFLRPNSYSVTKIPLN